ncbi:MAG: histidine kinase [Bacteroidales bacterium]|nr:histidine kinase [Bacteroidales bacterium]
MPHTRTDLPIQGIAERTRRLLYRRQEQRKQTHLFTHRTEFILALVLGLIFTLFFTAADLLDGDGRLTTYQHPWLNLVLNILLFYLLFLSTFSIFRHDNRKLIWRYVVAVLSSLGIVAAYYILFRLFPTLIMGGSLSSINSTTHLVSFGIEWLIVMLFCWLFSSLSYQNKLIIEKQQLSEQNVRIRFDTLKTQLSPHFLFNSLNTLDGLIGLDDVNAHRYVQQLASTYRYIMQNRKLVTLREELEFTQSYIYMMHIRYGDNLQVDMQIDNAMLGLYTVPISVQLLVENAIKHNVISNKHPLTISICTDSDHNTLSVSNAIYSKQERPEGEGLGLLSLCERFQLAAARDVDISSSDNLFRVTIPLLDEPPTNLT